MNYLDPFKQLANYKSRKKQSLEKIQKKKDERELSGKFKNANERQESADKRNEEIIVQVYEIESSKESKKLEDVKHKIYRDSISKKKLQSAYQTRSIRQVAKLYGIGKDQMAELLKKHGIKIRERKHFKNK